MEFIKLNIHQSAEVPEVVVWRDAVVPSALDVLGDEVRRHALGAGGVGGEQELLGMKGRKMFLL